MPKEGIEPVDTDILIERTENMTGDFLANLPFLSAICIFVSINGEGFFVHSART